MLPKTKPSSHKVGQTKVAVPDKKNEQ